MLKDINVRKEKRQTYNEQASLFDDRWWECTCIICDVASRPLAKFHRGVHNGSDSLQFKSSIAGRKRVFLSVVFMVSLNQG